MTIFLICAALAGLALHFAVKHHDWLLGLIALGFMGLGVFLTMVGGLSK